MKIYIDVLIITNFLMSLMYLRCAAVVFREKLPLGRQSLAAAVGGLGSLLAVPTTVNFAGALAVTLAKIGVMCAVTAVAFGRMSLPQFLRRAALYLLCELMTGGVCFAIITLSHRRILTVRNYVVYFDISIFQLGASCAAAYLIFTAAGALKIKYGATAVGYRVKFTFGNYSREMRAVADTGNCLTDSFTGKPVVVFRSDELYRRFSLDRPEFMSRYGFRLLPFETIGGEGIIFVTSRAEITVMKNGGSAKLRCCAGIVEGRGSEYAIFNPELLGGKSLSAAGSKANLR